MSTKSQISKNISDKSNITIKSSKSLLENFLFIIKKQSKLKKIKLSGFGSFYMHKTPSRTGRNPKTKESYIIKPVNKLTFRASSKIKEILN